MGITLGARKFHCVISFRLKVPASSTGYAAIIFMPYGFAILWVTLYASYLTSKMVGEDGYKIREIRYDISGESWAETDRAFVLQGGLGATGINGYQ
jgi:hypothetical protein